MDIKHTIDMIAGYYNGQREYTLNKGYSDKYSTIYTKEDCNAWLVVDRKGDNSFSVHLTDEEGIIIARDNYTLDNEKVTLKSAERMMNDSNTLIQFTPEELSILQSFGEENGKDTTDHLRIIAPLIKDEPSRNLALRTADKIDLLPEHSYKELFSTTQRRYEMENNLSIRTKIDRERKQASAIHKRNRERRKGDIAL